VSVCTLDNYRDDARTLMMAPLMAVPLILAEFMTLGGVGIAAPIFLILPILLAPLIIVAFIMMV